jgi:hypothetical protein
VGLGRVELPANGLGNRCSIHLSYRPARPSLRYVNCARKHAVTTDDISFREHRNNKGRNGLARARTGPAQESGSVLICEVLGALFFRSRSPESPSELRGLNVAPRPLARHQSFGLTQTLRTRQRNRASFIVRAFRLMLFLVSLGVGALSSDRKAPGKKARSRGAGWLGDLN